MKVLVTGGAGFLGINLVRYLLKKNIEVISFDIQPFDYPEKDRVAVVLGDIRNRDILIHAMKGVDIVIHAAAALPLYKKEEIFSVDVEGTRNVCLAAKECGVSRLIYISTTAVYGIPKHHPLKEDDPMVGVGNYGKAKIIAEQICQEFRQEGMIIPVLRPKSFIGPERLGVFSMLYDWAMEGKGFPVIGKGDNRYQFLDVEDLCEAIYLCMIKKTKDVNDIYNIGAGEFTTIKEDYQAVLDAAGFGKKIVSFWAWPMINTLRLLNLFRLSPVYKWVYETMAKDSFVSIEKAQKELGFSPKYSNKDALLRNFNWYKENADSIKGRYGVTHRVMWKQGVLRLAKLFF